MSTLLFLLLACARPIQTPVEVALAPADDCAAFDAPALQARLDRRTLSREREGNAAELLSDGERSFLRRFENAAEADMILVKTFIFSDDEVGRLVAELLSRRAREGAMVILQYDIKGSVNGLDELQEMRDAAAGDALLGHKAIIQEMRDAGVIVVPTNVPRRPCALDRYASARGAAAPVEEADRLRDLDLFQSRRHLINFDHEKYWITGQRGADGGLELRAILGGMNIASEYAYGGTPQVDDGSGRGGWRDVDVEVRGPVANDIVERFFDVMELNLGVADVVDRSIWNPPQGTAGAARIRFVWNQPAVGNARAVERLYRSLIRATPRGGAVRVSVAYFAPGPPLHRALARAARADRHLTIVTNSEESLDIPIIASASRYLYRQLLRADPGAALYEWNPGVGAETLHAKIAAFGACGPVIVGSANLDGLSSEHNSESVVLIRDPALRSEFDAMFERDLDAARARPISGEVLAEEALLTRVRQWGIYRVGWRWLRG